MRGSGMRGRVSQNENRVAVDPIKEIKDVEKTGNKVLCGSARIQQCVLMKRKKSSLGSSQSGVRGFSSVY
jgi:hypothetical protein